MWLLYLFSLLCCCLAGTAFQAVRPSISQQQTRAVIAPSARFMRTRPNMCPIGCECETPGVVSCINARLNRLPFRLPTGTTYFYAEHNRYNSPVLTHRNFTNYIGPSGRSTLIGMSLHNCSLTVLGFRTFTALKSLQELDLSNNRISIIEDNTFNGLTLNMLDLSYNPGIQLSKKAFFGCTIRRLAVRAVGLKVLDLSIFSYVLPDLMSLSLADNRLLTIDYRIFSCAPNLSTVYFARNPWWCGRDCSTLKLINYVNRQNSDLVMDSPPVCQPGYEEELDAELNKAQCNRVIADIKRTNYSLPPCPVIINLSSPSERSLPTLGSSVPPSGEKRDGAFVSWKDGVLANYSRPATSGFSDDSNVIVSPNNGGCFRISTVVAASIMSSVATLIFVLSLCLCVRACYVKCQNQPSTQSGGDSMGFHNGTPKFRMKSGQDLPNFRPIIRNGVPPAPATAGNGVTLVPSQGQPLLLHSSNSSDSGASCNSTSNHRHGNRTIVS